jgi:hypothetical protein
MYKEKFSFLPIAFFLLALTCASSHAQQQTPTPESTNETTMGAISGQIVNERGEPMPGANVSLRAIGAASPSAGRTTSADAEGRFRVTGLEAGLYIVTGYAPAYVYAPPETDGPDYHRIGESVRLELIKGGVITGTVLTQTGEPVVGIRVRAVRIRDAKGPVTPTPQLGLMERATDDRGIYRLYGLLPGTYLVSAGGGQGYQSYQLNPYDSDVPIFAPGASRDAASEYAVRGGEETTADIRYRSDQGRTVSGTVKVTGSNGASVMLMPVDGFMPTGTAFQNPGARGFEIAGVGDGEYSLIATEFPSNFTGGVIPEVSISDAKRISVKGVDISGIELIPKPPSTIGGRVVLETSKVPECQGKRKPVFAETLIDLHRNEKDGETIPLFMRAMGSGSTPDANGAFKFRNLSAGRYRFNPKFYARYWYLQSISIGAVPATATPNAAAKTATPRVDPAAGWTALKSGEQISNLTITLAEGAASIRGRVPVAEGGAIAAGTAVFLVPAEPDKATDVLRYFVTYVASDGAFAFNSLPPGRYWSVLQNAAPAEIATLVKLRLPESAEARNKLRRTAESQKSDVELKPCQTLADYELSVK